MRIGVTNKGGSNDYKVYEVTISESNLEALASHDGSAYGFPNVLVKNEDNHTIKLVVESDRKHYLGRE